VQRLHPSAEDLGKARHLVDRRDRNAEVADAGRRRPGRDDLDAGVVQAARELIEPDLSYTLMRARLMAMRVMLE